MFLLFLTGCGAAESEDAADALQGVVEFDERVVGFEVGGRIAALSVELGDAVEAGGLVAALASDMASLEVELRSAQRAGAEAQLALVRGGARAEEVRAAAAELRSARGPALLEIMVQKGARTDLGRPKTSPIENKTAFAEFLSH